MSNKPTKEEALKAVETLYLGLEMIQLVKG